MLAILQKYSFFFSIFAVPDPVASLTFDNVLDTSLQVQWALPPNINGILTGTIFKFIIYVRYVLLVGLVEPTMFEN